MISQPAGPVGRDRPIAPVRLRSRTRALKANGPAGAAWYIKAMPAGYLPILIFLAVAVAFPVVAIGLAKLLRPSAPSTAKLEAYECGIRAATDSRGRYTVRFYIIAILFVIFDVETIFLYPWAVRYGALGWFGVAEVAVFLAILVVGYIWAYKKGALEWV
ncbi:MAG TPA: NADH-quinone oxidoreductase subunit A [Candidatus Acidoferrales bacterium]|nr:NADH-quinone oxidoreductase subunit A [Candidatus Acidoferrales bacterium]